MGDIRNLSRARLLLPRRSPALLLAAALSLLLRPAWASEPARVEVKPATTHITYLGGAGQQREVVQGDRFDVVRRLDSYYVIRDGEREALIAISDVIPVKPPPPPRARWEYVVTTANAPVVARAGLRRTPEVAPQGEVLEVLGRNPSGATLYVLLRDRRTAEISARLVRPARPEEQPSPPAVGPRRGPVPLGCEISIDRQRRVRIEYVYATSFGERLGLQRGDTILEVNGEEIHSAADYDRASALLGGNLRILVQRRGANYPEMIEYVDPRSRR